MDIKKLEFLSGLKLEEASKVEMEKSLIEVGKMMLAVEGLAIKETIIFKEKDCSLKHETPSEVLMKRTELEGTHLTYGVFLAPKTIKK